ncbi:MAG: PQQ-binding-like beta-propeller repeat protein [Bacillota bacterium]|nr:PQQ-binding-like beta-propeller repeat protein [Bacillota bacterium]
MLFLVAGLALALVLSPLGARRLGSLQDRRVGCILALFLATFSLGVGVALARAYQARPPAPAGPRPEVLWSRTPWEGLWAYLAPRPWAHAGFAPADPAVDGDVVVFLGTPGQADILDSRDGTRIWSAAVEPPLRPLRSDTARNMWTRPVVSGRHALLRPQVGTPLLILDSGSRRVHRVDLGEPAVEVLPAEGGGFFVLTPDRLCLLDGRGAVVWSYRPQGPGAPEEEMARFSVNEFSPPGLQRRLVSTPAGLVGMSSDWLCLCDPQTGEARWLKFPRGRFAGMQVSPSGDVVYVAEAGSQGRRIIAYDSNGAPMWFRELPAECYGMVWSAAPDGLLVWVTLPGAGAAEYIGRDGRTRYRLPVPERDPVTVRYLGGVFLVASHNGVSAYRAADGHHLWTITEPPGSRLPGGYLYYLDWAVVGADLVIPRAAGLSAHDLLTGSLRWVYTPPGGFFGMAAASDAVYVTSGRGLFALRCR